MVDLKRTAVLLAALAEGKSLAQAAEKADLDLTQARTILTDLAERLAQQAKEWQAVVEQEMVQTENARKQIDDPNAILFAFDGGSRGNPGPSAGAAVALDKNGKVLAERYRFTPETTNNVAEYHGLLEAIRLAADLGVRRFVVQGDSELIVKQINGEYKVKNRGLMPLFIEANKKLRQFDKVTVRYVRREENAQADALVNRILDEKAPKKKKTKAS
ncbi:MAG TPA: ribonuclease HI family protein [bacterium]|nr:ribonuclease HI family protein [bacterium]